MLVMAGMLAACSALCPLDLVPGPGSAYVEEEEDCLDHLATRGSVMQENAVLASSRRSYDSTGLAWNRPFTQRSLAASLRNSSKAALSRLIPDIATALACDFALPPSLLNIPPPQSSTTLGIST
ncbi:hypothetical protein V8C86DRAFT_1562898 [Haematococcus lacustris]